jgi:hypothetical protein
VELPRGKMFWSGGSAENQTEENQMITLEDARRSIASAENKAADIG